eukprot:gnl/TRDRNA2_/TRDRNA2_196310_c0_seq1.p1 gnl/TRDRNA2_/TRDRNA2_196310_c0~~gnl/TRDRNA2_/TRDRNA2_196310_c0_seq1.p1  ORF type:complete len:315 (+),score=43.52 gnl/TRDRNA2_/TRDRNA2_196310_c0_seq1:86-1030(+)
MSDTSLEVTGLACVILAAQLSMLANTVVKMLSGVPMIHLMQARFMLQWVVTMSCCFAMWLSGRPVILFGRPGLRILLTVRALCNTAALGCLWYALALLPVGEATAIIYLGPVVCGVLAMFLLREQLGYRFALQAAVSCLGVVMVVNPFATASGHNPAAHDSQEYLGIALAAAGCLCFATSNCLVRLLPGVQPLELQVYSDTLTAWIMLPLAQLVFPVPFDRGAWGEKQIYLLVLFTIFGLGASFCTIVGYGSASASKCAVFSYLEVPSSFASQVFFFGHMPSLMQISGAWLIVGAAVYRLIRDNREMAEEKATK